jgi:hypothetical protein
LRVNDYYEILRTAGCVEKDRASPTNIWGEKQERRGEYDCPGYLAEYLLHPELAFQLL